MPPDGRFLAKLFGDGFRQNDPDTLAELNRRYDDIIAPVGSPADERLVTLFAARSTVGGYAVFEAKMHQGEPK